MAGEVPLPVEAIQPGRIIQGSHLVSVSVEIAVLGKSCRKSEESLLLRSGIAGKADLQSANSSSARDTCYTRICTHRPFGWTSDCNGSSWIRRSGCQRSWTNTCTRVAICRSLHRWSHHRLLRLLHHRHRLSVGVSIGLSYRCLDVGSHI